MRCGNFADWNWLGSAVQLQGSREGSTRGRNPKTLNRQHLLAPLYICGKHAQGEFGSLAFAFKRLQFRVYDVLDIRCGMCFF